MSSFHCDIYQTLIFFFPLNWENKKPPQWLHGSCNESRPEHLQMNGEQHSSKTEWTMKFFLLLLLPSQSSSFYARKYFQKWFLTSCVSNSLQAPRPGFDTEAPEWTGRDSPSINMFYPLEKERNNFFPPLASWETSMSRQPCLNMSIQGALQSTLHESTQANRWLTELSSGDTVSLPALLHECAWMEVRCECVCYDHGSQMLLICCCRFTNFKFKKMWYKKSKII